MKKFAILLLSLALLTGLFPRTAYAAENTAAGLDLTAYLSEISAARGFEAGEEDIDKSLAMYGLTKEDFTRTDEIKAYLGEVIKSDFSNLDQIYSTYGLDQNALTLLLKEYGEDLNDYIFLNDLDFALTFYTADGDFEQEADFEAKLEEYLADVSAVRGFTVTREAIASYLSEYYTSTDDFETVSDLSDYLGEVIKADLSNLDYFETNYDMDEQALLQLLEENGRTMNDFIYMDQLEELVWSSSEEPYPGADLEEYMDILKQIGLTEAELMNVENHFLSIADYLSSPDVQAHMEDLGNRMLTFAETLLEKASADENYKLSDAEVSEFAALYEDILSTVKLKVVFSIIKDGTETQYSILELMKMENMEDADFKVAFYNDNSELLADAIVTSDFIHSYFGEIIEDVQDTAGSDNGSTPVKTVKGGALPKTAGNYIPKAFFGLLLIIAGVFVFRKVRTDKIEISAKQY